MLLLESLLRRMVGDAHKRGIAPEVGYHTPPLPPIRLCSALGTVRQVHRMHASISGGAINLFAPGIGIREADQVALGIFSTALFGALVHEFDHSLQLAHDVEAFEAAAARTAGYDPGTATEAQHLHGYYIVTEEREAHASQCAAEVWFDNKGLNQTDFLAKLLDTKIYQRIADRLSRSSTTPAVQAWWTGFLNEAWTIYQTWQPHVTTPAPAPAALPDCPTPAALPSSAESRAQLARSGHAAVGDLGPQFGRDPPPAGR